MIFRRAFEPVSHEGDFDPIRIKFHHSIASGNQRPSFLGRMRDSPERTAHGADRPGAHQLPGAFRPPPVCCRSVRGARVRRAGLAVYPCGS